MFEPEKIIEQQREARATRVMLIAALIGLCIGAAIFVGLMYFSTQARTSQQRAASERAAALYAQLKPVLDRDEPKAAAKAVWDEDRELVQERVFLSPVLEQLARYKPARGQFWYSEIRVTLLTPPTTRGQPAGSPLLAQRELTATGYVQIVGDDKYSREALAKVGRKITENPDVTRVVGVPTFEINGDDALEMPGKKGRYARFIVRARRD